MTPPAEARSNREWALVPFVSRCSGRGNWLKTSFGLRVYPKLVLSQFPPTRAVSSKGRCACVIIDHFKIIVWARNGASGALLTALLRSSPYWAMAKRAFFPSCSRDENFPLHFQVGTGWPGYGRLLTKRTFGSLSAANLVSRTAVYPGIWVCVSVLVVIDLSGAVALVLFEFCV